MPAAKGYLRWNSAPGATYNPDHSTPTTDGSNGDGKSAKGRKGSPFACLCRGEDTFIPPIGTTSTSELLNMFGAHKKGRPG